MNSVGFEKEWLTFLDVYVRPLQEAAYMGYYQKVWIISIDKIFIGIIIFVCVRKFRKTKYFFIILATKINHELYSQIQTR